MNKFIPIALSLITAVTLTVGSSSVLAQDKSAAASSSSGSSAAGSATKEQDFQAHKAKILQRISDRLTKIQQIQSCVQAANDRKELHACRPHDHKHHDDKDSSGK